MSTREKVAVSGSERVRRVLVLLSGGIDSATCAAFYTERGFDVASLFVDYGHPAAAMERDAARSLSMHLKTRHHEVTVTGIASRESGFVPARNAVLFATALGVMEPADGLVALGIHAGTPYPDCTKHFLAACQSLADVYAEGAVQVAAPFIEWIKPEVVECAKKLRVPFEKTYSCEAGGAIPCGECLTCKDLAGIL